MKSRLLKKITAIVLGGMMLFSMVGCGNQEAPESVAEIEETEETTDGKEKLTIAMCQSTDIQDWDTNYLTTKLEEEMNIDVEFVMFSSDKEEAKTKLSLMINSEEQLPDVVLFNMQPEYTLSDIQAYGEAGIFVSLDEYLADSSIAPNYNEIAKNNPEDMEVIKSSITCSNGSIYSLFAFFPEDWNFTPFRCYINQTWLDALGLQVPTTTEELKTVLEAFATQDPNGNGLQDEVPLTGCTAGWATDTTYYLMNSFVFSNANQSNNGLALAEDEKTVIAPFVTDEWRDGLEYMADLCESGLLDPALFTMDTDSFKALLCRETNVVGCVVSGSLNNWTGGATNANFREYTMLPPLEGPEGIAYTPAYQYNATPLWFVTKDCKNPELAVKVGDWFLSLENSLTVRYGEEGVNWSIDEADLSTGTARFADLGYDCTLKLLGSPLWGTVHNGMWNAAGPRYMNAQCYRGMDVGTEEADVYHAQLHAQCYENYAEAHPKLLPNLTYTVEESESVSAIMTDVKDYVANQMSMFITGNVPLDDANWDNYKSELENMGLSTWLKTAQTAYDRMSE